MSSDHERIREAFLRADGSRLVRACELVGNGSDSDRLSDEEREQLRLEFAREHENLDDDSEGESDSDAAESDADDSEADDHG